MKFFDKLLHSVKLMGFQGKRDEFYEGLAKSYESRELLRDFLVDEMRIAKDKKTSDPSRAYALQIMLRRLTAGEDSDIGSVLAAAMPATDKMMLAAVRDAQDKPAVLRALGEAVRQQKEMRSTIVKGIIPPMMILPGVFAFCWVLANKSIPIIVKMAPPEVWTPFNALVRAIAEFIGGNAGTVIAVVAALIFFMSYQMPRWTGAFRLKIEQVNPSLATLLFPVCPILVPLSVYRDAQAGLMLNSLAVFLQSGRTLTDALDTIRQNSTPWMRWHINKILSHLQAAPTEYVKAFSKGLLSANMLARLASTIRTNPRFDQVLIQVGTKGAVEIRKEVAKQASTINIMLIAAGGALVMLMMVGQMSITDAMQEEMSPGKVQARMKKRGAH